MKTGKLLSAFAVAALLFAGGCAKDKNLTDRVDGLEERVSSLEDQVNELNKITIPGMQSIVAAIQGDIYVTSVTPGIDGYTITFSNGTTAVLTNGKDGEKGDAGKTPAIGVVEVEGEFYWAVDEEPLLDAAGNKIPVHSATPQLRINEGKWQVSYDEGKTWEDVTSLGNAGGSTISIEDGDTTVTFFINGEKYVIQKELPFYLVFAARKDLGVPTGEEYMYEYTLSGVAEGDEVEVDVLNCTAGWEARVISVPSGETPGYIGVKHNENATGKVFIYASNGRGKTDIKSLVFEEGVLTAAVDVKPVLAAGGEITVSVTTNMDYELYIERTQKWISVAPQTKATHTDVITLVCEANGTGEFRSAEVDIINPQTGDTPKSFEVLQYPADTVATDIASLENVADGTVVTLYQEAVMASSAKSAIVSDGTSILLVTGITSALPVGKEITLSGVKSTDEEGIVSVALSSYEVSAETTAVTAPEPVYIGMAPYSLPAYTIASGKLAQDAGAYSLTTAMGQTVIIESPLESLSAASKVGSYVSVFGYVTSSVVPDGADAETDTMIATAFSTIEFKENNAWALSYSTDASDAEYPEVITNTVSGSTVPYTLNIYSEAQYAKLGNSPESASLLLSDDILYYFDLYGSSYDKETLYGIFVHSKGDTGSDNFAPIDFGKYVAVAAGIAPDGTPTGDYKVVPFEKKEPVSTASYADFIGRWSMSGTILEVTEKVAGSTYNVTGLPSQADRGLSPVEAEFSDGKFILKEQKLPDVWNHTSYGACDIYLSGSYKSGYSMRNAYGWYTETPEVIFTAYKTDDSGTVKVAAGSCANGKFLSFGLSWQIQSGDNAGKGNYWGRVTVADMTRLKESSAAYKAWLGKYVLSTKSDETGADTTYNVSLSEALPDQTFSLNGLGVDGIPVQYNADEDKCTLNFVEFSSNSSYKFYLSGLTNDGKVCTGDSETGAFATLTKSADKSIRIENIVYKISDERPEVYAKYWGIIGQNISTNQFTLFNDVDYVVNPATMTPSASTASLKSVSSPKAAGQLSIDRKEAAYRWKIAVSRNVQRRAAAKVSDHRAPKSSRAAGLRLK